MRQLQEAEQIQRGERAARLMELSQMLPDDGLIGISGKAAAWLFDDLKATWIYGYLTSTIVTSYVFCSQQLAGLVRLISEEAHLTEHPTVEELAHVAANQGIIGVDTLAELVGLQDRWTAYAETSLGGYEPRLERHLIESGALGGDDPLLEDARRSVAVAIKLLLRNP